MNKKQLSNRTIVLLLCLCVGCKVFATTSLEQDFKAPKTNQRPYVWWHWMGPNFSKEGIVKDLEAMKEQGIGGATIFNITSAVQESQAPTRNNPWPEQTYRSPAYWEALRYAAQEAKRLGLELGLHNTVGYSTTGGPWIDEEQSMQRVLWREVSVEGGKELSIDLPTPEIPDRRGWGGVVRKLSKYKEIGVVAVKDQSPIASVKEVVDLSNKLTKEGILTWNAPVGKWKIYRFISASTGYAPHPLPDELIDNKTFEVDKMTLRNTQYHWDQVLSPLKEHLGEYLGKTFRHFLIDSYEAGHQSWSEGFRAEFIKRKGYDPLPWMVTLPPILRGIFKDAKPQRVIESPLMTARFEWDYQDVISSLFIENGWRPAAKMIKELGCQLQFEPYGGPVSLDIPTSTRVAHLPMGEFWTPNSRGIRKEVSASARAAGLNLIGAEAFTGAPGNSAWDEDPAYLKPSGDFAFLSGVNRLILHHWVHQPYDDRYKPGMSMGWWGTHFGRHQTWAKPGRAYFDYLSRCQAMLQHGEEVVDYLSIDQATGGDAISWADFVNEARVKNGLVVLASGRAYRFVELPQETAMQPDLLKKVFDLLRQGATFVGTVRPVMAKGLKGYPLSDQTVKRYADLIWGTSAEKERKIGKGVFLTGDAQVGITYCKMEPHLQADHSAIRWVERREGDCRFFFVVNTSDKPLLSRLSIAVRGMVPELWNPLSGTVDDVPVWSQEDARTLVSLSLEPRQSMFIVFRRPSKGVPDHLVRLTSPEGAIGTEIIRKGGATYLSAPTIGVYQLEYASGKVFDVSVQEPFHTRQIKGLWHLDFAPATAASRFQREFIALTWWNENPDPLIRFFSGTVTYAIDFDLSLAADKEYYLDLGELSNIAEVRLNGQPLGVVWCEPFRFSGEKLQKALVSGSNRLEISITNTWRNRLIGDEHQPQDMEWGNEREFGKKRVGRSLSRYPDWFLKGEARPTKGRETFVIWNYFTEDSPLVRSGLKGPVLLVERNLRKLSTVE